MILLRQHVLLYGMSMVLTDSLSEPYDVIAVSEPLSPTGFIEHSSTSTSVKFKVRTSIFLDLSIIFADPGNTAYTSRV